MAFHTPEIVDLNNVPAQEQTGSLYLVDDETELLTALAESLRAVGFSPLKFNRPELLLAATGENDVGCVITDLRMPGIGGVELIKQLKERESCLSVILLTAFADVPTAVDVMKLGAAGVLEKPFDLSDLVQEISTAMRLSEDQFAKRGLLREARAKLGELSQEEAAVLDLAISGCTNRDIAEKLAISPRTVDRRRHSALQKLDAESVADYAVLKTRVDEA